MSVPLISRGKQEKKAIHTEYCYTAKNIRKGGKDFFKNDFYWFIIKS